MIYITDKYEVGMNQTTEDQTDFGIVAICEICETEISYATDTSYGWTSENNRVEIEMDCNECDSRHLTVTKVD